MNTLFFKTGIATTAMCFAFLLILALTLAVRKEQPLIDYRPFKHRILPPRSERETAVTIPVVGPVSLVGPRHRGWLLLGMVALFLGCFAVLVLLFD